VERESVAARHAAAGVLAVVAPMAPGTPEATGLGARLKAAYAQLVQAMVARGDPLPVANGKPYLPSNHPALLMLYQAVGQLNPQGAAAAAARVADLYKQRGYDISDVELNGLLDSYRGPSGGPQDFAALPGVGAQIRQGYDDLARARGGPIAPNDPQLLALVRAAVPNTTDAQAQNISGYGHDYNVVTGTVVPDEAVDRYAGQVKGYRIPLPHQLTAEQYDTLYGQNADPVARGLAEGALRSAGWDVDTYKRQHLLSRPVGSATSNVSVGRQFGGVF